MTATIQNYLEFMTETAYLAGRLTLGYFNTGVRPDYKEDDSPVTIADREAEQLIRRRIEERFPRHAIVGEEHGEKAGQESEQRWFIDPIDGTKSFIRGVPLYAVLIGLEIAGRVEAGVAYFPALDEMLSAGSGLGCQLNGRPVRVSQVEDFAKGVMSFTDINNFPKYGRAAAFERLAKACYFRAGWGDAYGYMLAASGRVELMLDAAMSAWDCGPLPVILREAGGYFGDWQGNETIYAGEGLATSQALLPQVLRLIEGK
jgi:myo-inositol-1(or 4)-monophosphatase